MSSAVTDPRVQDTERILRDCFTSFARLPRATLIDEPYAFGAITNLPVAFFSGIASTTLERASDVDDILERYRVRNAPFRWWLTPSTRPTELESILLERHFRHTYDSRGMVAPLSRVDFTPAHSPGLTVRRVESLHEFDVWLDVFMSGFSRPPAERGVWRDAYAFFGFDDSSEWAHYVGFADDEPVSTSSVLMAGDLGGIYCVVTLPQARGRGIGRAVTLAAMQHAQTHGATRAVLQSSEMGFGVYRAIGFEDVCPLRLYDWKPEYDSP